MDKKTKKIKKKMETKTNVNTKMKVEIWSDVKKYKLE